MRASHLIFVVVLGCSGSRSKEVPTPAPGSAAVASDTARPADAPAIADAMVPVDAPAAPAVDAAVTTTGGGHYISDCSLTHPIARDPCSGAAASTRGLQTCTALGIKQGQACSGAAPSCYLDRQCSDGRQVVADYLICASQPPGRCLTKSSKQYKHEVRYLGADELRALAHQIEALPLARYRYKDQVGGSQRLGFLTEDAPAAPFVSDDGRTVDLYALLAASIAAIQTQDERIRALEQQLKQCTPAK